MKKILNMKSAKFLAIIIMVIIGIFALKTSNDLNFINLATNANFSTSITNNDTKDTSASTTKILTSGVDLIPNSTNTSDMKKNTTTLQNAINNVSESGGGIINLPSGTFYFYQGGTSPSGEKYAIRCRNNVTLKGAGTNENDSSKLTILKPYYNNSKATGGMDMFYFNNYKDTGYNQSGNVTPSTTRDVNYKDLSGNTKTIKNQTVYLINADFYNFIIDGDSSRGGIAACGGSYQTDGKGFMINLFKDCDWDNIVVKNTDATGFGMDCPINSTINNCKAINCGKAATTNSEGASGFGIGTGYSNDESIIITNCVAINNKKFGFFFEHQARFTKYYPATTSKGFVVSNSIAGGNLYDFGGLKAFNVTYENVKSISGSGSYSNPNFKKTTTSSGPCGYSIINYSSNNAIRLNVNRAPTYISMYSNNIHFTDSTFNTYINDVSSNKTQISWAINKGIIPIVNSTTFQPRGTITRFEVVKTLWKYKNMPGTISTTRTSEERTEYQKKVSNIGFTDLSGSNYYNDLDAIVWAYNQGIISKDTKFNPNNNCTRAQFITMLYRLAGSPSVTSTIPFTDVASNTYYYKAVAWGYKNGVVKGDSSSTFSPDVNITKEELAIFLYRYNNLTSNSYSITYNLLGGSTSSNNITTYKSSNLPYTLKNPTRSGYTFLGWTGSNISKPSKSVKIQKGTTGDLVYTANWKKNLVLTSISLKKNPTKTSYFIGDNIDTTGLELTAYYDDYSTKKITSGFTISPTTFSKAGTQKVTITYGGKKISFNVTVSSVSLSKISIKNSPNKTNYYVRETVDTTGLVLTATYSNGTTKDITSGFTISPTSLSNTGTQKITVTYGSETTSFNVTVNKEEIESISIKTLPKQTEYFVGDSFSSEGLTIYTTNNNGYIETIEKDFELSIKDNTILREPGTKKVEVKYNNFTTSFDIMVSKPANNSLILTSRPNKTSYLIGDKFDITGLKLESVDSSGVKKEISDGFELSIPDETILTEEGTINVTASYSDKKVNFDIEVLKINNITIKENSLKTEYNVNEKFESDDIVLIAEYSNGTKEEITNGYDVSVQDGDKLSSVGTKEVTISYGGIEIKENITVEKEKKKSINITYIIIPIILIIIVLCFLKFRKRKSDVDV